MEFCHKVIPTRSQYADVAEHKCHCPKGHSGKCEEFPFLNHLIITKNDLINLNFL